MSKRISELTTVTTAGPNDLIELAIVDGESPTGFSSRNIAVGNLITGGGAACRLEVRDTVQLSNGNQFTVQLTRAQLEGCSATTWNSLRSAAFKILVSTAIVPTPAYNEVGSSTIDLFYDSNGYSWERYIGNGGKQNSTTTEPLPLTNSSIPPDFGEACPLVYDVFWDSGNEILNIIFIISSENNYDGQDADILAIIDYNAIGYNAA